MKKIKLVKDTDGTLKDYIPGGYHGTVEALKEVYPDIVLYKSTNRKSDGHKFKSGDWIETKKGSIERIVAFDHYNYPLKNGGIRKMTRAIYYGCMNFTFHDIEGYPGII